MTPILLSSYFLNQIPIGNRLDHINEFNPSNSTLLMVSNNAAAQLTPVLISSGLPPVPKKLVYRAQEGLFVEMAELLPHKLISAEYYSEDHSTNPRQQHYKIRNILEWVQCFGIYVAIISQKEPEQMADLLGYQQLIIHSSLNCHEGGWLVRYRSSATSHLLARVNLLVIE